MRNPPNNWIVRVGRFVHTVQQVEDFYETGLLDEFSYHRYKRAAKPFDATEPDYEHSWSNKETPK